MNKQHSVLITRAPRLEQLGQLRPHASHSMISRLGLGLRLAGALRAGGAMGALAILPVALSSQAKAQDTAPPRVTVATPADLSYAKNLPTLSGTVMDEGVQPSGVRDVKVAFLSVGLDKWWNGTAFVATGPVLFTATLNSTKTAWTYSGSPTNATLPDGLYVVQAYATDTLGNAGAKGNAGFVERRAYVDNTKPNNITFEEPAPGQQVESLSNINGRAVDVGASDGTGSGVKQVEVTIQRPGDGQFWNGSAYQAAPFRLATDLAGSFWSLSNGPNTAATLPDGNYTLTAYALDGVGNEGSASQTTLVQQPPPPVAPDTSAPTITLATPVDQTFAKSLANPTGAIADTGTSGLKGVTVAFFSDRLQKWWDGTAFASDAIVELSTSNSNGQWAFSGPLPAGAALTDGLYVVLAFGDDNAGNRSRAQSVVTIDNAAPSPITFEQPTPGAVATNLLDISGRAFDNTGGSGVAAVQVTIQRPGDGQYWNGSAYQVARVRLDTTFSGGFWSLKTTLRAGADLPNGSYILTAFAQDTLGNEGTATQTVTVTQPATPPPPDSVSPQITLATPPNNSTALALAAPSGTASDAGGSGLSDVKVAFFRTSDQKWWNGTAFASDTIVERAATIANNGSWRYNDPVPAGANLSDGLYVVLAFADDGAGNRSRAQSVVTIDNTRPVTLSFQNPSVGATVADLTDINGFVADNPNGVGIAGVQLSIANSAGQFWNGTAFVAAETRLNAQVGGGFWSVATSLRAGTNLPDGAYTLRAFAQDKLGNQTTNSLSVTAKAPAAPSANPDDITPPRIALASPTNGAFAKSFIKPTGTVSDEAGGAGLRDVRVAFFRATGETSGLWWDGTSFSSATPVELDATIKGSSWSYEGALPSGAALPDGLYVVLAFADDANGNRNRDQALLTVDSVAPTTLSINSPAPGRTVSNLADINGRVDDNANGSGIAGVQVEIRNPSGQFWNGSAYQATRIRLAATVGGTFWSLAAPRLRPGSSLPQGLYILSVYAQDRAGNQTSLVQNTQVIPDLVPPVLTWTAPLVDQVFREFPTFSGTITDAGGAGVASVGVELIRQGRNAQERNAWWNGQFYQAAAFRLPTTISGGKWTVSAPLPKSPYLFSTNYVAHAVGTDRVGNEGTRDVFFSLDRLAPAPPVFGMPRANTVVANLGPIIVVVRDSPNPGATGSGVVKADFLLRRDADGKFWNGSTYVSQPVYLPGFQSAPSIFRRDGGPLGTNLTPGFYTILARVTDRAGNSSQARERVEVRDSVAPTISIDSLAAGRVEAGFGVISGRVADSGGAGVSGVRVSIRRLSDGAFWNGRAFTRTVASLAAAVSGGNWSLSNVPPASLTTSGSYEVVAVATDGGGNTAQARVVTSIIIDTTPATITITDPSPGTFFRRLERVSGTASDNAGGVGLDRVTVAIQRNSDGLFWNGRAFTDAFFPFRATLSGNNWVLAGNLLPASSTGQFTVIAQAFDKRFNQPQNNKTWEKVVSFNLDPTSPAQGDAPTTRDVTPPTITVSEPRVNTTFRQIVRVSGTAADNAGGVGLGRVVVGIRRNSDGLFWNGRAFVAVNVPLRATINGNTWSLTSNLPPASQTPSGYYTIIAQAFDKADNFNDQTSQRAVTVTLDASAPAQGEVPSTPGT